MKTKILHSIFIIYLLLAVLCSAICFMPNQKIARADTEEKTSIPLVENSLFSLKTTAVGRNEEILSPIETKSILDTNEHDTKVYYCFNWKDISYLYFEIDSSVKSQTDITVNSYSLVVSSKKTEDYSSIGYDENETTILSTELVQNNFAKQTFSYYIDKSSEKNEDTNRAYGNDYGLYKFDLKYTMIENGEEETHTQSVGQVYIAIIPDNIDKVIENLSEDDLKNLSLLYSVSSSNRLMNAYNFYLSNEELFKYVNPNYIVWNVTGQDKDKNYYILSDEQKYLDEKYNSYKSIWDNQLPSTPYGTSFLFDSNDIEGYWTIHCHIYNSKGEESLYLHADNISTVKTKQSFKWWIIILVVGIILIISTATTIIVLLLKKHKENKDIRSELLNQKLKERNEKEKVKKPQKPKILEKKPKK